MRVLLVSRGGPGQPNIGLSYVLTCARRRLGPVVSLVDLTFERRPFEVLLDAIRRRQPDLVGFSVNSINLPECLALARTVKAVRPGAHVLFGGVHPTLRPRETLLHDCVDSVCIGEGELALPEFVEAGLKPVPGVWTGLVGPAPLRPFHAALDELPFPDWAPWQIRRYQETFVLPDAIWVLSSRGCEFSCTFCSNAAIRRAVPGRYLRVRSPQNVVQEVLFNLQRRPVRSVFFESENMLCAGDFWAGLASTWRQEGLHRRVIWGCKMRADLVTEQWVREASALGCRLVSIGLESGNERIRHRYAKRIDDQVFVRACDQLRRHGVAVNLNVMVGTPLETVENIRQSVRFAARLGPTTTYFSPYVPLPGTPLGEMATRPRTALERLRLLQMLSMSHVSENLRLLHRGLRRHGLRFALQVLIDTLRTLARSPDPRALLASSPVKSAYYRLHLDGWPRDRRGGSGTSGSGSTQREAAHSPPARRRPAGPD